MSSVGISLSAPKAGKIGVRIRLRDDEMACFASSEVDSLTDLVYAGLDLVEMRLPRPVVLFQDPHAIRVSFDEDDDLIRLMVTHHPDLAAAEIIRDATVAISGSVGRFPMARAIWGAMNKLETSVGADAVTAEWHHRFPAKEVAQLAQYITRHQTAAGH